MSYMTQTIRTADHTVPRDPATQKNSAVLFPPPAPHTHKNALRQTHPFNDELYDESKVLAALLLRSPVFPEVPV